MDALAGRSQTTRGIWLACSPKVPAPTTLVMDLEGSDGRERGEDDTSFERQSALFALATADILLVNMWAKDVGRETGSGKPLLKTIFQVNLKLFQPSPGARRTVLLFVLRDRTKTPLEKLKETWEVDLNRLWASIAKPPAYEESTIADFFDVQYAALSNYEDRTEDFLAETTLLRRRFTEDANEDDGLLRQSPSKLPGQALTLSMHKVWEVIHENKDLNLPAHRVMVANIRCAEIADERIADFESNPAWQNLAADAQEDLIPGFGEKAGALLDSTLASYDEEARYFDAGVSAARQLTLVSTLQGLVKPAFDAQINLASSLSMETFRLAMTAPGKSPFENGAEERSTFVQRAAQYTAAALTEFDTASREILVPNVDWTAAAARETLQRELASHQAALRAELAAMERGADRQRKKLLKTAPVVGVTCCSSLLPVLDDQNFDVVILDECSQIIEPLAMAPAIRAKAKWLIAAGDPKQLPPVIASPALLTPASSQGLLRPLFVRLSSLGATPHLLRRQYRCHPSISAVPNTFYYDGRLLDGCTPEQRPSLLPGLPPVVFVDVRGQEQRNMRSTCNPQEAQAVLRVVERALAAGICPGRCGIICFYRAQVTEVKNLLHNNTPRLQAAMDEGREAMQTRVLLKENAQKEADLEPMTEGNQKDNGNNSEGITKDQGSPAVEAEEDSEFSSVQVATVDAFQGAEKDLIILTTATTRVGGAGAFTGDAARLNVALTRAKHNLVVVGCAPALEKTAPAFAALIKTARSTAMGYSVGGNLPALPSVVL